MPIPRNFNLFRAMLNNSIDQHPLTHHYSDQEAYIMFLLTLAIAHQRQNQLLIQDGEQENHNVEVAETYSQRTNARTSRLLQSALEGSRQYLVADTAPVIGPFTALNITVQIVTATLDAMQTIATLNELLETVGYRRQERSYDQIIDQMLRAQGFTPRNGVRFFSLHPVPPPVTLPDEGANAKRFAKKQCPPELLLDIYVCPLSQSIMTEPVFDIHHPEIKFERAWILEALKQKLENPCTRTPLTSNDLREDPALKNAISTFIDNLDDLSENETKDISPCRHQ